MIDRGEMLRRNTYFNDLEPFSRFKYPVSDPRWLNDAVSRA
jgi:hypothetical protein